MRREKISFVSGTVGCAGYLFLPEPQARTIERPPVVILAHGFSGTMDWLVPHAERFAAGGTAALVFDYRGFWGAAASRARSSTSPVSTRTSGPPSPGLGDVTTWTSTGWRCGATPWRAHVISVAADDPRIVAVVAQIPFNGFPPRIEGRSTAAALRLFGAIIWDFVKGRLRLDPFYIPMVGKPGELAVTATLWKNQVAPRGLLQMLRYRPAVDAARLQAPLLVCAAEQDRETPVDTAQALANAAPRGVLRVYPETHFDFYTDPAIRDQALADQLRFLHEHLHASSRVV